MSALPPKADIAERYISAWCQKRTINKRSERNVPSCGAFFKLHHCIGGGVRGAHRHGLVPASEQLCILSS